MLLSHPRSILARWLKIIADPAPDRILIAQLHGEVKHRTRGHELSGDEEAAAVAELRVLAAGRTDLLAEVAGILTGFHEGDMDEPQVKAAARLLIAAGADESLIPQWVEEGQRRAEAAASVQPAWSSTAAPGPGCSRLLDLYPEASKRLRGRESMPACAGLRRYGCPPRGCGADPRVARILNADLVGPRLCKCQRGLRLHQSIRLPAAARLLPG